MEKLDLENKIAELVDVVQNLREINAQRSGENTALSRMLKEERKAVRDLQQQVATLEWQEGITVAENNGLAEQVEDLQARLKEQ